MAEVMDESKKAFPIRCPVPGHGSRCRYAWERDGKRRYRAVRHVVTRLWRREVQRG